MDAAAALTQWVNKATRSIPYGPDRQLVTTPWGFDDGATLVIMVQRLADDHYLVTDRGLIADRLGDADLDLTVGAAHKSWAAIRESLAATFAEVGAFELATTTTGDGVGRAISEVAARALQAAGLEALGKHRRPRSFSERVMAQASGFGLTTIPRVKLPNKFGGEREVSFQATGEHAERYVIALGGGEGRNFMAEHDRAKAAFDDAVVDVSQRVVAIARDARPQAWQLQSLNEVASVFEEERLPDLWSQLAAA